MLEVKKKRPIIANLVRQLCEMYARPLSKTLIDIWHVGLEQVDDERIKKGFERMLQMRTGKWMPMPAEFKEYCPVKPNPHRDANAGFTDEQVKERLELISKQYQEMGLA